MRVNVIHNFRLRLRNNMHKAVCVGRTHLVGVVPVVEGDWEPPAGRHLPQDHIRNGLAALEQEVHMLSAACGFVSHGAPSHLIASPIPAMLCCMSGTP